MTVYLDLVMILNFLVDFLLLLGTNRLTGFPSRPWRCALGALVGSVYSGACIVWNSGILDSGAGCVFGLVLCAGTAFGWDASTLKRGAVFVLLSMALGGLALCIGKDSFPVLVLAAGGLWVLCRVSFGNSVGDREYTNLTIAYEDRSVSLIALRDSGNTLRDPLSGEQVLVISASAARRLTGLTQEQLEHPMETLASGSLPGLRLIPYRAVGQGSGMLLGMRFADVTVGGRKQSAVVAFAPAGLGQESMYQALTGGAI